MVGGTPVGTDDFLLRTAVADLTATQAVVQDSDLELAEKAFFSQNMEAGLPKLQGLVRMIQMCFPSQLNHLLCCAVCHRHSCVPLLLSLTTTSIAP